MIDYKIISSRNTNELRTNVKSLLEIGWVAQGAVIVQPNMDYPKTFWYFQTMVKI